MAIGRRVRKTIAAIALSAFLCPFVCAATPTTVPSSDSRPVVSTTPRTVGSATSLADLQNLQKQIQKALKTAIPATVGVRIGMAQGSGVIVTRDGYVLCAGHVVAKPDVEVTVILYDGHRVKGKTLGLDSDADTGLIKITDPGPYAYAQLGTSQNLQIGDWTIAIGHPGGYRRDRPPVVRIGRVLMNLPEMIQTDNLLVGGDSGGPLFDLDGRVIGIHSRIGSSTTNNMHVPVDEYVDTWDQLAAGIEIGKPPVFVAYAQRPFLGMNAVEDPKGCKVTSVRDGSPAANAGLQENDVVLDINGEPVKTPESVGLVLSRHKVGDEISIKVDRNGTVNLLRAKLSATP